MYNYVCAYIHMYINIHVCLFLAGFYRSSSEKWDTPQSSPLLSDRSPVRPSPIKRPLSDSRQLLAGHTHSYGGGSRSLVHTKSPSARKRLPLSDLSEPHSHTSHRPFQVPPDEADAEGYAYYCSVTQGWIRADCMYHLYRLGTCACIHIYMYVHACVYMYMYSVYNWVTEYWSICAQNSGFHWCKSVHDGYMNMYMLVWWCM